MSMLLVKHGAQDGSRSSFLYNNLKAPLSHQGGIPYLPHGVEMAIYVIDLGPESSPIPSRSSGLLSRMYSHNIACNCIIQVHNVSL